MARVGLKNLHAALLLTDTETETTYGEVRKLAPAVTANVTPNVETSELHGDDILQEVEENLSGIDVEIGMTDLTLEDYAFLLGKTIDDNGGIADGDEVAPYVALGYEMPLSGGKGSRMVWLYKGKFGIPAEEATTKQGAVEFQTATISGTFMKRVSNKKWRYRIESNETNQDVIAAWFTEVQKEPTGV